MPTTPGAIYARIRAVLEATKDARDEQFLRVSTGPDPLDEGAMLWHGAAYVRQSGGAELREEFGRVGIEVLDVRFAIHIGWMPSPDHETEFDAAERTLARVRGALETDTGWPAGVHLVRAEGRPEIIDTEDPTQWELVQEMRVTFERTFPATA